MFDDGDDDDDDMVCDDDVDGYEVPGNYMVDDNDLGSSWATVKAT